jgi:hypothetical protein
MVSYLASRGATAYTFRVVDNDTIDVTEIEEINEDGSLVLGNTAPFTRVAGSTVNKESKPFALTHPYIGKWGFEAQGMEVPEWGPGKHDLVVRYEARTNGILTYEFTLDNYPVIASVSYFIFDNVLVFYDPAEGGIATSIIISDDDNPDIMYLVEEGESPVPFTRIPYEKNMPWNTAGAY